MTSRITIEVDRDSLPDHTEEEFQQWVMYEIGEIGGLRVDNPLSFHDLEAKVESFE